jgi:DNA-binding transcriptional LysR family regulator
MDLNQIEHFLRVAELGSINRAAKELGLSQPALSRSLSQLEQDLGQQLVVRCRTGITITEAGSILASRGLALLREAGAIREALANDPAGRVVVGMPAALRHLVTLPALQAMRSTSPGIAVRVHEGFNVFLYDMMKHGMLDMAVIAVDQVSEVSIAPAMLLREPLVLVRSANLPPPHDPARIEDVVGTRSPRSSEYAARHRGSRGPRTAPDCQRSARARKSRALSGIRSLRTGWTDGDAAIGARGTGHEWNARGADRWAGASLGLCGASPAPPFGAGPSAREHHQEHARGCRP